MRRKMLPEEKELREAIDVHTVPHSAKPITRRIPALIRAVEERCAKVADETGGVCERCAVTLAKKIRQL